MDSAPAAKFMPRNSTPTHTHVQKPRACRATRAGPTNTADSSPTLIRSESSTRSCCDSPGSRDTDGPDSCRARRDRDANVTGGRAGEEEKIGSKSARKRPAPEATGRSVPADTCGPPARARGDGDPGRTAAVCHVRGGGLWKGKRRGRSLAAVP
jgi:hypothetical protein